MKTPDEARRCWCPFARFTAMDDDLPANRWGKYRNPEDARCIADECMAWRWGDWQKVVFPAGGYDQQEEPKDVQMGYCGLAGKP